MKIRSFASRALACAAAAPHGAAPCPHGRPHRDRVRTVERVRYVPVYYTTGCGGCAAGGAPRRSRSSIVRLLHTTCGGCAPAVAAPVYYAPRYYAAGCGSCGQPVAAPYYWAVRTRGIGTLTVTIALLRRSTASGCAPD